VTGLPERLTNGLSTFDRLAGSLRDSRQRVSEMFPLAAGTLQSLSSARDDALFAFLKRFELFADTLLRRVLRPVLEFAREDVAEMSNLDVLYRLETLGGIEDADRLSQIIALRNRLTHESPMSEDERATRINAAYEMSAVILGDYAQLVRFVDRQKQRIEGHD